MLSALVSGPKKIRLATLNTDSSPIIGRKVPIYKSTLLWFYRLFKKYCIIELSKLFPIVIGQTLSQTLKRYFFPVENENCICR